MSEKKIILLLFIFISLKYKIKKDIIESIIMRYNNKFRGKNISVKNIEDNLMIYILYVKSIKEGKIKKIIHNKNYECPKISFIISVFNKENYLNSLITSMQMQDLKEIEIVVVDDCSSDKSVKIINNFRKRDKRIILINNKKNMGSLYSRAIGGNIAKGDYFIFFDSDDIILKDGILKSYNHALKYKLDLVQFLSIINRNEHVYTSKYFYTYKNVINQPILAHIFYYYNKSGVEQNLVLWDKLVKKEVVLKSLKYIGEKFIQSRIMIENDVILLFSILKMAESYQFIESPGYYYFAKNKDSITNTKNNPIKTNEIIRSILMNIQFLFEKTSTKIFIIDS
jgi:glycosyltransferase involved in cell wall biosynthesis